MIILVVLLKMASIVSPPSNGPDAKRDCRLDCPINMSSHIISLFTKNGWSKLANKESIRINEDAKKGMIVAKSYNLLLTWPKMDDYINAH